MNQSAKTILITGSASGIGFETAKALLQLGHTVILTARNAAKATEAISQLSLLGLKPAFLELDITKEEQVATIAQTIAEKFGHLDVLINNAGIFNDRHSSVEVPLSAVKEHLETNFYAPLRISQAFVPLLLKSNSGRIINVSSNMGSLMNPGPGSAAYRFSKTAINALTVVMSQDLAHTSIKVNSVCPGWCQTDMGGHGAPRTAEEGADTIVWLAVAADIPNGKFLRDRKEMSF
jgi:NAD(P)-dependent dehydrogenase (short-subunit alcohol dehydrogenase family)